MVKIKGWTKIYDEGNIIQWESKRGSEIGIIKIKLTDGISRSWSEWTSEYRAYDGRTQSRTKRKFITRHKTKQEALKSVTKFMRSHPNG